MSRILPFILILLFCVQCDEHSTETNDDSPADLILKYQRNEISAEQLVEKLSPKLKAANSRMFDYLVEAILNDDSILERLATTVILELDADSDSDGFSNLLELMTDSDPFDPTAVPLDLGGDGIPDVLQIKGDKGDQGEPGISITWLGELDDFPTSPDLNAAFHHRAHGIAYLWDGSQWSVLSRDGRNGQNGLDGLDGQDGINGINGVDGRDGRDGVDGQLSLIRIDPEDASLNCGNGGQRIASGIDDGDGTATAGDHILQDDEIDQLRYVCNGEDGQTGSSGADGYASLLRTADEPAGANCPLGGVRVDSGIDDGAGSGNAADGTLQDGEIDQTSYMCERDLDDRPMVQQEAGPLLADVSQVLSYQVVASDPLGGTLYYFLLNAPAGVMIDLHSGLLTWKPAKAGDFGLLVAVMNERGGMTSSELSITVGNKYENFSLLLHFDGDGSTVVDSSPYNHAVSAYYGAYQTNAGAKFGNSIVFDGIDDYLSVASDSRLNLGIDDFTISCWLNIHQYTANKNEWYFGRMDNNNRTDFALFYNGANQKTNKITFVVQEATHTSGYFPGWLVLSAPTPTTGTWHHYAIVRLQNTLSMYIDGILQSQDTQYPGAMLATNSPILIGGPTTSSRPKYQMDEFVILKGIALWQENFLPPESPY